MKQIFAKTKAWREKGGIRPFVYLPFVFFSYAILDVMLRFTYRHEGMLGFRHPAANLLTIGWCLLLTAIVCVLPGRIKKVFLGGSVLFFAALTVAHSLLRGLFHRFFMFSTLAFAEDGFAFADSQYIRLAPLVAAGIIWSLLSLLIALYLAPTKGEQRPLKPLIAGFAAALLGVLMVIGVSRVYLTSDNTLVWNNYADPSAVYESFTDSTATLLMAGLYQYTARDLSLSLDLGGDISAEDADALSAYAAQRQAQEESNDHSGIFAGKNLILIQLEAIDTWMLSERYMPNLWALKQQSMVFENHYSPAYITAGTLNTEFIANTGLLPATGSVSSSVYQRNAYPYSLANQMRSKGYSAHSFHGSEGNVYSRATFHPAVGYEAYHGGTEMGMADFTMDSNLIDGYDTMVRDEPFLTFIITYSGHGPYGETNGAYLAHKEEAGSLATQHEGNYVYAVAGAMETDAFVGELLANMEADGSLEDTVLVFYADHYNYYMMNDAQNMAIKGVDDMNLLQHTDFFIYSKDRAPEPVSKVTSSLDILPTLANLFGLDDSGAVYPGHDAFSSWGGYAFFNDSSWIDGETYWRYGSPVTELSSGRNQEISDAFRMGNLLLLSDYFASIDLP